MPQGTETFLGENRGNSRAFTHAVIDAGADLVIGHGPHVLRGMEVYKGRLIAYSLGNFGGYEVFGLNATTATSMVLQVTLTPDGRLQRARIRPTQLVGNGTPAPGGSAIDARARAVTGRLRRPRAAHRRGRRDQAAVRADRVAHGGRPPLDGDHQRPPGRPQFAARGRRSASARSACRSTRAAEAP